MATIQFSPYITVDFVSVQNDTINYNLFFQDNSGNTLNFSAYTYAESCLKDSNGNTVAKFTSTGSTYSLDISQLAYGAVKYNCNSLAVTPGAYDRTLVLKNAVPNQLTILNGKWIITSD